MDNFPLKTDLIQVKGKAKNGKVKVVKYDRSFLSRVIQNEKIKRFYDEIKNYCMSFERVKNRSAWGSENFTVGNETVVKFVVIGGAFCVCLALAPTAYSQSEYPHGDLSERREFAATPFLLPIRTAVEVKTARRVIAEAFTTRCIYTVEFPTRSDYVAALPTQKDEALIKKGLIKVTETEMSEADAKKAIASALQVEAAEEKLLEGIGEKRKRTPKKRPEPVPEEPVPEEPVSEEPVSEEQSEEVEEEAEVSDESENEDELDTVFELAESGEVVEIRYDRSFLSRIIQNEQAKAYYNEIKNYVLSFGMKPRPSWGADSFYHGRTTYIVTKVRGKTLTLYLALDPKAYEERIYHHVDVSELKTYQKTPMMIRIRSDLGLRKAERLIEEMLTAASYSAGEIARVDYVAMYPFEDTDTLVGKRLIKRFERVLTAEESQNFFARGGHLQVPTDVPSEAIDEQPGEEIVPESEITEEPEEIVEEPTEEVEDAREEEPEEPCEEAEEVVFELAESEENETEAEEVVFELAEEVSEEEEDVVFELAEDGEDDEDEDIEFELIEEEPRTDGADEMRSYEQERVEGKTVTLKQFIRGFAAKMRQGAEERKGYYAAIKARMLSFKGVKVSESFAGDGYKKGARALMKARIRGKTLCLFFALNPDNYKETVYHQQNKGDTKAYATTPMMVRVKSEQGLKRALRLIGELERNYVLQEGMSVETSSVLDTYGYEETPVLVEKGLIKTRLVTVSAYEAEALLKRKTR